MMLPVKYKSDRSFVTAEVSPDVHPLLWFACCRQDMKLPLACVPVYSSMTLADLARCPKKVFAAVDPRDV